MGTEGFDFFGFGRFFFGLAGLVFKPAKAAKGELAISTLLKPRWSAPAPRRSLDPLERLLVFDFRADDLSAPRFLFPDAGLLARDVFLLRLF